jgi:hypothetical protein
MMLVAVHELLSSDLVQIPFIRNKTSYATSRLRNDGVGTKCIVTSFDFGEVCTKQQIT